MKRTTEFDIIVFGATSFVGQIIARTLLHRQPPGKRGALKWALAGRSQSKLETLRDSLSKSEAATKLPLLVADAADEAALRALCARTRVLLSTVGPYALYGSPLVAACVASGTAYCDLTGETPWMRRMISAHEEAAQQSGARIVHACGFDSVPSDLGVAFLQRESVQRYGAPCTRIAMRVKAMRGGLSGGTAASLMNVVKEASKSVKLARELADPYSLCPPDTTRTRQRTMATARYDRDFACWIAPFVMAGINTRVVQRSHALMQHAAPLTYDEAMMMGRGAAGAARAAAFAGGLGGFVAAAAVPPSRWALERFVLPKPGTGPSERAQEKGFYDLRFIGHTAAGERIRVKVTGDRDPGYGSTAKIIAEAAACLAEDLPRDAPGGFHTPASLMAEPLTARLQEFAGLTFEVLADK